ncbi:MAG: hypothetical protein L0Z54_02245 [Thermoplasmata archaeon]|nr:hypothetical protein [Thermoplasmata archaeon]
MSNVREQEGMTVDILRHIDAGICDIGEMAESLDVSPEELRDRLQIMGMLGFIQVSGADHQYDPGSRGCMGCGMSRVCASGEAPSGTPGQPGQPGQTTYTITGKGRYLLDKWEEAGK